MNKLLFDEEEIFEKIKPESLCDSCGLCLDSVSKKVEPFGNGELGIAILLESPSDKLSEVRQSKKKFDFQEKILRFIFNQYGIDLYKDCKIFYTIQCSSDNYNQSNLNSCRYRIDEQMDKFNPDIIFAYGTESIKYCFEDVSINLSALKCHGRIIPDHKRNINVVCSLSPLFFYKEKYERFQNVKMLKSCIELGLNQYKKGVYKDNRLNEDEGNVLVTDIDDALELLNKLSNSKVPVAFDYETTGTSPYKDNYILTMGFSDNENIGYCIPYLHSDHVWSSTDLELLKEHVVRFFQSDSPKVIQNWQFEELWTKYFFGCGINNVVTDTMIKEHILDNRSGIAGQKFQCFVRWGTNYDKYIDQSDLKNTALDKVAKYNILDCRYDLKWYYEQLDEMKDSMEGAYSLFHEAIPVFTSFSERGVKINEEVLNELESDVNDELNKICKAEKESEYLSKYRQRFGQDFMSTSSKRKQQMYYDLCDLKPLKPSPKGKEKRENEIELDIYDYATDKESMEHLLTQVDEESDIALLIRSGIDKAHLNKLKGTYISLIKRLMDKDGYLHPSFLLHTVTTYRSSSADPNFQNFPKRNKVLSRVRKVMVPRNDGFLEADYGANEVKYIATISGDKQLVEDVNAGLDFHRHFAGILYEKPEDEITKAERYAGKNGFVFPEFYGSYYKTISRKYSQWKEEVIKDAESQLWTRYPDVKKWQNNICKEYYNNTRIYTPLGFELTWSRSGFLSKNNIINSPIQGTAFHRLVRALIDVEKEMRNRNMKSIIVGQIHDSIIVDYVEDELEEIMSIIYEIARKPVWKWDNFVEKEVEFEIGNNLLDMEEIKFPN